MIAVGAAAVRAVYRSEGQLVAGEAYCNIVLSELWDAEDNGVVSQLGDKEGQGFCVVTDSQCDYGEMGNGARQNRSPNNDF